MAGLESCGFLFWRAAGWCLCRYNAVAWADLSWVCITVAHLPGLSLVDSHHRIAPSTTYIEAGSGPPSSPNRLDRHRFTIQHSLSKVIDIMRSSFTVAAAALSLGAYFLPVYDQNQTSNSNIFQAQLHLHNSPNNVMARFVISSTSHKALQTREAATSSFRSRLLPATHGLVLVKARL